MDSAASAVAGAQAPASSSAVRGESADERRRRIKREKERDRRQKEREGISTSERAAAASTAGTKRKPSAAAIAAASAPKQPRVSRPSARHAEATASDAGDSVTPAKRQRRSAAGDDGVVESYAAEHHSSVHASTGPSASVWSVLADPVYLPRFLTLVHAQLATARSSNINMHMLASAFRQKLVEGGWAREQHYVLQGTLPDDDEAARTAASGTHPSVYLKKSRRVVGDFTPAICQQLWRLCAYHRDPSPQAAVDMLAAATKHRELEERCRRLALPLIVGGKNTPLPQGAVVKLERMYAVPPGGPEVAERRALPSVTPGAAAPAVAADNDDGSDVEDSFEFFPGLYGDMLSHGAQYALDGSVIDRWAKGHHVHVPPPQEAPSCRSMKPGQPPAAPLAHPSMAATSAAVRAAMQDPSHPHHASFVSLSSRAHLTSSLNELRRDFRHHVDRNTLYMDFSSGEWLDVPAPVFPSPFQMAQDPSLAASATAAVAAVPTWVSPTDDQNLLDSILDWLKRQPLPSRDMIQQQQQQQDGQGLLSAVLPQATGDWLDIRAACSAHAFPLGFLRRRWWLLFKECHELDPASRESAGPGSALALANPSLALLAERVANISHVITERMAACTQQPGEMQADAHAHQQEHTPTVAEVQAQPANPATVDSTEMAQPAASAAPADADLPADADKPADTNMEAPDQQQPQPLATAAATDA